MTTLTIKLAYDTSVSHYVGREIIIPDDTAKEFHIQDGECAVLPPIDLKKVRISYRGAIINLPFEDIEIRNPAAKQLDIFSSAYAEDCIKILKIAHTDSLNITAIAGMLGKSSANVGIKVRKLEERGLVQKKFAGSSVLVGLTKEGERVLGEMCK